MAHGFSGVHTASLYPAIGLVAGHVSTAHEGLFRVFYELAGFELFLNDLCFYHEFRVQDGRSSLIGNGGDQVDLGL